MSKRKTQKQFYLLSLGCSKNTVDSESMAALLGRAGFQGTTSPDDAGRKSRFMTFQCPSTNIVVFKMDTVSADDCAHKIQ
jgi:hypothetical protein